MRRRGYDPAEVDAHLAAVAAAVEELRRSSRSSGETSAATASERVRAIVQAAETSAGELHRHAPQGQGEVAAGHGGEAETGPAMLGRLEALQGELTALIESLRTGEAPSAAGLNALERNLREVRDAGPPSGRTAPAPARAPRLQESNPSSNGLFVADLEPQLGPEKVQGDPLAVDIDAARLIALNMALNGTPREETERHLAQNFELPDRRGLVDEVYTSVER